MKIIKIINYLLIFINKKKRKKRRKKNIFILNTIKKFYLKNEKTTIFNRYRYS
jgi:hypothetical protein